MNYMSFDFGLDWKRKISTEEIEAVVNQFDVIIVLERLTESLILLKQLLCMDFTDIYLPIGCGRCSKDHDVNYEVTRPIMYERLNETKYGIDLEATKIIEENFIFNDIELYNAVGRKFERDVRTFGVERMISEIKEYEKLYEQGDKREKRKRRKRDTVSYDSEDYDYYDDVPRPRTKRPASDTSQQVFQDLVKYMVESQGYCGHFADVFGVSRFTDLLENGQQPFWRPDLFD